MLGIGGGSKRRPGGPELERLLHWRGELLASRDLNDGRGNEEERLWWHQRAVHDAYGVVVGLRVDDGRVVQPGLAYDAYGRELPVAAPAKVPPPGDAAATRRSWTLLLRYREPKADSGDCSCAGEGGRAPWTELVWRPSRAVGLKDGVALTRGVWGGEGTDLFFERDGRFRLEPARPLARPRLGNGVTPQGHTAWRSWVATPTGGRVGLATARGIEVEVDTGAAGFTRTPCYFAWLQGGLWQVRHRLVNSLPIERVVATGRDRFTYSLWDWRSSTLGFSTSGSDLSAQRSAAGLLSVARQRLSLCWLGIELDSAPAAGPIPQTTAPRVR